jgi:heme/copper-type cytochrome/quinol oxidase subunit 3
MSTTLTPRRGTLPNGVWAVALVIATEGAFLGCLIAAYLYLATRVPEWPPPGMPEPRVLVPALLTALLVLTTPLVFGASVFARRGGAHAAWLLVFVASLLQAAYLAAQIYFFQDDLSEFSPTGSAYGSAYFTLLGAHHAHVAVGLLLDVWLLLRLLGGRMTPYRATAVRIAGWYWVFVAGIGVLVTLTVVSPSL